MALSICIICFNEEENIRRCLESSKWADEIIVVDSMSQDRTVEIAKEYTENVYQREWSGYVEGKNFALSKATCEWVLSLDADEQIPEELRVEIGEVIGKKRAKEGYTLPRLSFYQGRWIKIRDMALILTLAPKKAISRILSPSSNICSRSESLSVSNKARPVFELSITFSTRSCISPVSLSILNRTYTESDPLYVYLSLSRSLSMVIPRLLFMLLEKILGSFRLE